MDGLATKKLSVLFSQSEIKDRVYALGREISECYDGKNLVCVGVLNGAYAFYSDLVRSLSIPCEVDFLRASSYSGTSSTGEVSLTTDLKNPVEGKHVLIVEDILDTGRTLKILSEELLKKGALSVKCAVMLDKPSRRVNGFKADFVGCEIDDLFVVGYGLDCDEMYRNLPYIAVYNEEN